MVEHFRQLFTKRTRQCLDNNLNCVYAYPVSNQTSEVLTSDSRMAWQRKMKQKPQDEHGRQTSEVREVHHVL